MKGILKFLGFLFFLLVIIPVFLFTIIYEGNESLPPSYSYMQAVEEDDPQAILAEIEVGQLDRIVLDEEVLNRFLAAGMIKDLPEEITYFYLDLEAGKVTAVAHLKGHDLLQTTVEVSFAPEITKEQLVVTFEGAKLGDLPLPKALLTLVLERIFDGERLPEAVDLSTMTLMVPLEEFLPYEEYIHLYQVTIGEEDILLKAGLSEALTKGLEDEVYPIAKDALDGLLSELDQFSIQDQEILRESIRIARRQIEGPVEELNLKEVDRAGSLLADLSEESIEQMLAIMKATVDQDQLEAAKKFLKNNFGGFYE